MSTDASYDSPDRRTSPPTVASGGTGTAAAIGAAVATNVVTAAHAATEAASKAATNFKFWRDLSAFAFVMYLSWQMYTDFVKNSQNTNMQILAALGKITSDATTSSNAMQGNINTALHGIQSKMDVTQMRTDDTIAKMISEMEAIRQTHVKLATSLDRNSSAMDRTAAVVDRISSKLGFPNTAPKPKIVPIDESDTAPECLDCPDCP